MNRLYRGKSIISKDYVYGYLKVNEKGTFITQRYNGYDFDAPVYPETVGQSTGEFDINGKEVYAGHIVELYHNGELQHSGKVVFEHGAFCVKNADGESFCLCLAHSDGLTIKIVAEE